MISKKKSKFPTIYKTILLYYYYKTILFFMEGKNPKVLRTKDGRIMLLSKCVVSNSKKLKFIK